jgi:hypothetical protein
VDALEAVGADVAGLARRLAKPLRPLWLSPASTIWVDQVGGGPPPACGQWHWQPPSWPHALLTLPDAADAADTIALPGAPRVAPVKCQQALAMQRACPGGAPLPLGARRLVQCARQPTPPPLPPQVAQPDALPFTPLILVSASQAHSYQRQISSARLPAAAEEGSGAADSSRQPDQQQQCGSIGWSYVYVPGAGDDEESWACGLTPTLMWSHYLQLLSAGPAGVPALAAELAQRAGGGRPSSSSGSSGGGKGAPSSGASSVATDEHHPRPQGCEAAGARQVEEVAPGIFTVPGTALLLGSSSAVAAAAGRVWAHAGSVLNCGTYQLPALEAERRREEQQQEQEQQQQSGSDTPLSSSPGSSCASSPSSANMLHQLWRQQVHSLKSGGLSQALQQVQQAQRAQQAQEQLRRQRYQWLPVRSAKQERSGLRESLPAAMAFMQRQLGAGRTVLVCDDDGHDTCVCVVVAALLAGVGVTQAAGASTAAASVGGAGGGGEGDGGISSVPCLPARPGGSAAPLEHEGAPGLHLPNAVSKQCVRQKLAAVSSCYPSARPTRGLLKQVFSFFDGGAGRAASGKGQQDGGVQ